MQVHEFTEHAWKAATEQSQVQASEPFAWQYTSHISGAVMLSHQPPDRLVEAETFDIAPLYTTPQPCPKCELYAAEMSAAREAGFYSAQDLFTSYIGLQAKCKGETEC